MNDKAALFDELVETIKKVSISTDGVSCFRLVFSNDDYWRLHNLIHCTEGASAVQPIAPSDAMAIALAEYKYWSDALIKNENIFEIVIGASAASANIYAAVSGVHRAPWHPKKP